MGWLEPCKVGGIPLRNAIIRSATFESAADSGGGFSAFHERLYRGLAQGEVGAIITGMAGIDGDSRISTRMVSASDEGFEPSLRRLKTTLEDFNCPIIVQLSHCGVKAMVIGDGGQPFGPSELPLPSGNHSRSMTRDHIARVVEHFARAAARCKRAGADGVQLHAAHGYCLSQFLSPYYNKRDDEYGGDIVGRSRMVMEVYDAVRAEVGGDYPVWIKINGRDCTTPGLSLEESTWVCGELDWRGIDALEVSGGVNEGPESRSARPLQSEQDQAYYADDARRIAEQGLKASVISVGGHRSLAAMDGWLNSSPIAGISLSRPLIAEPDLVASWRTDPQHAPRCLSCNQCYKSKDGLQCPVCKPGLPTS